MEGGLEGGQGSQHRGAEKQTKRGSITCPRSPAGGGVWRARLTWLWNSSPAARPCGLSHSEEGFGVRAWLRTITHNLPAAATAPL